MRNLGRWACDGLNLPGRVRFKNLFGGGGSSTTIMQQAPTPTAPPPMPDPFGPATMEAARKAGMGATARGGRNSTQLTTSASRAGNTIAGSGGSAAPPAYSATTLSGAK